VFYDRLQEVLVAAGFDVFVESLCKPSVMGAPSLPPGRCFRMHLVGYVEGIDSERGPQWRYTDRLSLRDFLGLELRQRLPDHSWLSKTRGRLPLEVHEAVFAWVLERLAARGLVRGERIGVDASAVEAWRPRSSPPTGAIPRPSRARSPPRQGAWTRPAARRAPKLQPNSWPTRAIIAGRS